jgi:AcrR family transcriptional regulator
MAVQVAEAKPRKETRFSKRRALIIRAAARAFGRKGFHATTLDEIAAELDVTKASLYYYFSTKEELLYEVHLLSLGDILRGVDKILHEKKSPLDQLQSAITEHLRHLAANYEGAFLLQQEYELQPNYREEIVKLRDAYQKKFLSIVQEGVRQKIFRVKDSRMVVYIILGAINWFVRWYRASGRLSVDEIADAYVDFILYGLLADPRLRAARAARLAKPARKAARRSRAK